MNESRRNLLSLTAAGLIHVAADPTLSIAGENEPPVDTGLLILQAAERGHGFATGVSHPLTYDSFLSELRSNGFHFFVLAVRTLRGPSLTSKLCSNTLFPLRLLRIFATPRNIFAGGGHCFPLCARRREDNIGRGKVYTHVVSGKVPQLRVLQTG